MKKVAIIGVGISGMTAAIYCLRRFIQVSGRHNVFAESIMSYLKEMKNRRN